MNGTYEWAIFPCLIAGGYETTNFLEGWWISKSPIYGTHTHDRTLGKHHMTAKIWFGNNVLYIVSTCIDMAAGNLSLNDRFDGEWLTMVKPPWREDLPRSSRNTFWANMGPQWILMTDGSFQLWMTRTTETGWWPFQWPYEIIFELFHLRRNHQAVRKWWFADIFSLRICGCILTHFCFCHSANVLMVEFHGLLWDLNGGALGCYPRLIWWGWKARSQSAGRWPGRSHWFLVRHGPPWSAKIGQWFRKSLGSSCWLFQKITTSETMKIFGNQSAVSSCWCCWCIISSWGSVLLWLKPWNPRDCLWWWLEMWSSSLRKSNNSGGMYGSKWY